MVETFRTKLLHIKIWCPPYKPPLGNYLEFTVCHKTKLAHKFISQFNGYERYSTFFEHKSWCLALKGPNLTLETKYMYMYTAEL